MRPVTIEPQHKYADRVMTADAEVLALCNTFAVVQDAEPAEEDYQGEGSTKGKGKGGYTASSKKKAKAPSGWKEKAAALLVAVRSLFTVVSIAQIENGDNKTLMERYHEYSQHEGMQAAMSRHMQRHGR